MLDNNGLIEGVSCPAARVYGVFGLAVRSPPDDDDPPDEPDEPELRPAELDPPSDELPRGEPADEPPSSRRV